MITHTDCTAQTLQILYKIISYHTLSTKYIAPIHACISNKHHTNIGSRPGIRQFSKKIQEPPQNSRYQTGDMEQIPHCGFTNIKHHGTKFSCLGFAHSCSRLFQVTNYITKFFAKCTYSFNYLQILNDNVCISDHIMLNGRIICE